MRRIYGFADHKSEVSVVVAQVSVPCVGAINFEGYSAPPRHRPGIAAPRRGPCARARLSLRLAGHVFVPGAGILSEIRLPRVRPARLSARPAANFLSEAADPGGVTCQS